MSRRTVGGAAGVVSATAFGALAIFARLAYAGGGDVTAVLFLRFSIAAVVMAAVLRLRRTPWPRGRLLVALLLYAFPPLVMVLSVVWLGERMTVEKAAALLLALAGTVLTIGPELGGERLGIVLGLSAALIYAVYIVVADTSTLSTLEPAVTAALAAAVLGERVTLLQLAGGALILAAVVVLARSGAATGQRVPAAVDHS